MYIGVNELRKVYKGCIKGWYDMMGSPSVIVEHYEYALEERCGDDLEGPVEEVDGDEVHRHGLHVSV